jgi:hypothetical protein
VYSEFSLQPNEPVSKNDILSPEFKLNGITTLSKVSAGQDGSLVELKVTGLVK